MTTNPRVYLFLTLILQSGFSSMLALGVQDVWGDHTHGPHMHSPSCFWVPCNTQTDSDTVISSISSMPPVLADMMQGKQTFFSIKQSDHRDGDSTRLFLNLSIQLCLNNVTNLHQLTSQSTTTVTTCPTTQRLQIT